MNTLTEACSPDDEDCLEVVPTTRYYDLDAIDLSVVELIGSTASPDDPEGSGSGDGFQEDSEAVCKEIFERPTKEPIDVIDGIDGDGKDDEVTVQEFSGAAKVASPSGLAVIALTLLALVWGHCWSS